VFSLNTVTLLAKLQQTILVRLGHPRLMKFHREWLGIQLFNEYRN
jgi:hypothetical protein